jgi:hypothetical protein
MSMILEKKTVLQAIKELYIIYMMAWKHPHETLDLLSLNMNKIRGRSGQLANSGDERLPLIGRSRRGGGVRG